MQNTLVNIINTILSNKTMQELFNLKITKITPITYKLCLIFLKGNPKNKSINELLRSIMIRLPANTIIENILDTQFRISKIENKLDRAAVIYYLSK